MKNGRRMKAAALVSGASLATSFGMGKAIQIVSPAPHTGSGGATNVAASSRTTTRRTGPSTLLVIKRAPNGRRYVYAQPAPRTVYVPAPAAPAPAPAPVTRTS